LTIPLSGRLLIFPHRSFSHVATHMRFTIKRIMLAVAALALIMGGLRVVWLRDRYQKTAAYYAMMENLHRDFVRFVEESERAEEQLALAFGEKAARADKEQQAAEARRIQRQADYYAALRRKYEQAARRPWNLVDPDPPPP
jgi:hypothetical protein